MMQPCASAAKLRGGGSILESGAEGHGLLRITTTSDRHRQFIARGGRVPKLLAIATSLTSRQLLRRAQDHTLRYIASGYEPP